MSQLVAGTGPNVLKWSLAGSLWQENDTKALAALRLLTAGAARPGRSAQGCADSRLRFGASAALPGCPPRMCGAIEMKNLLKRLMTEDRGQDVIEYALLAAGISIAAVPIIPNIGTAVSTLYGNVLAALPGGGGGGGGQ